MGFLPNERGDFGVLGLCGRDLSPVGDRRFTPLVTGIGGIGGFRVFWYDVLAVWVFKAGKVAVRSDGIRGSPDGLSLIGSRGLVAGRLSASGKVRDLCSGRITC